MGRENENRTIEDNNTTNGIVEMDHKRSKYPHSIVWTPIPLLTWIFPVIGHMGIAYTNGKIRDFAGPYFVSEDHMAFGKPTKYWILDPNLAEGGSSGFDRAIYEASEEYKTRVHNLICDNCHSHCSYALNLMNYKGSRSWNMVWLACLLILHGRYVSIAAFVKTWLPFVILVSVILSLTLIRF